MRSIDCTERERGGREKDKEKIRHFEEVRTGKARTVSERSPRPELSQNVQANSLCKLTYVK